MIFERLSISFIGMVSDVSIASTLLLNSPTPNIGNQEEYIERKTEGKFDFFFPSSEEDFSSNEIGFFRKFEFLR